MTPTDAGRLKAQVESLTASMLQNATVQCDLTTISVKVTVAFDGLGETFFLVPLGYVKEEQLPMFIGRELRQCMYALAKEKYFR